MLTNQLATKYARALYEVAVEENKLNEFGAELKSVTDTVYSQADLADFINHPRINAEAKKKVLGDIMPEQLSGSVHNFIMLLLDKRRESLLKEISKEFTAMSNAKQDIVEAEVTVAYPLSSEQEAKLVDKLSKSTGKTVKIQTKIDKSIVGGVVVKMGDKLIDGSVTSKIKSLGKQLMAN